MEKYKTYKLAKAEILNVINVEIDPVSSIRENSTVVRVCEFLARQTRYRKSLQIRLRFWLPPPLSDIPSAFPKSESAKVSRDSLLPPPSRHSDRCQVCYKRILLWLTCFSPSQVLKVKSVDCRLRFLEFRSAEVSKEYKVVTSSAMHVDRAHFIHVMYIVHS
ncbi:uncharacterized protein LOC131174418 isoform X1 [Hevea brasiliensis]|uniref:uncharacterized protein LOC131174418 isoform X1 n=1 Tax=Hevea brasiliensis TaxID=3981 RepID=UPI0025D64905|nr:uncharacterized protein LOC131174418 isoform X1 [Hevea brasiliensis]